jgi:hypothetical protein
MNPWSAGRPRPATSLPKDELPNDEPDARPSTI